MRATCAPPPIHHYIYICVAIYVSHCVAPFLYTLNFVVINMLTTISKSLDYSCKQDSYSRHATGRRQMLVSGGCLIELPLSADPGLVAHWIDSVFSSQTTFAHQMWNESDSNRRQPDRAKLCCNWRSKVKIRKNWVRKFGKCWSEDSEKLGCILESAGRSC